MERIHEAEKLLSEMSRAEKALILQWVVRDLGDASPVFVAGNLVSFVHGFRCGF